jgi:4-hydroxybenzoate polyprenyltransferase
VLNFAQPVRPAAQASPLDLLTSMGRALRLHQWAKNALLFVPLLLAHALSSSNLRRTTLAFFSFCLCASATYIVNDLVDLDADRRHPRKRYRPFAAGDLPPVAGRWMAAGSLTAALLIAWSLSSGFLGWLLFYVAVTLAYSLVLKRIELVDVVVLAGLYTLRLLAGGAVTGTAISPWLLGFSLFLFLSLAMVKRFSELQNLRASGEIPNNGRGYHLLDIESLRSFGTASGYASVVIFALYISSRDVTVLYRHPHRMWLMAPFLLLWISRFWLLASRGELDEDPIFFALSDHTSILIGGCLILIGLLSA